MHGCALFLSEEISSMWTSCGDAKAETMAIKLCVSPHSWHCSRIANYEIRKCICTDVLQLHIMIILLTSLPQQPNHHHLHHHHHQPTNQLTQTKSRIIFFIFRLVFAVAVFPICLNDFQVAQLGSWTA